MAAKHRLQARQVSRQSIDYLSSFAAVIWRLTIYLEPAVQCLVMWTIYSRKLRPDQQYVQQQRFKGYVAFNSNSYVAPQTIS
ncbi:hypothetical protein TNCV_2953111 [Trichonephila clavipes]|nr:hypothetical protein TNCV_2953111 [Trichonephila clavipes]